jgi:hypothetical protein
MEWCGVRRRERERGREREKGRERAIFTTNPDLWHTGLGCITFPLNKKINLLNLSAKPGGTETKWGTSATGLR